MRLPKLNVSLARRVKKHILSDPRRLEMDSFIIRDVAGRDAPPCGTQACIAGWTVLLSYPVKKRSLVFGIGCDQRAKRLLGITDFEADKMFFEWTKDSGVEGAKEVAAKIDKLIESRKKNREASLD